MSRLAIICAILIALGLGLFVLSPGGMSGISATTPTIAAESGLERHAFLDDLDLDSAGGNFAVLLHAQVTGGTMRAVLDVAAIRAAQGRAFYADDPKMATQRAGMSSDEPSPKGTPPDNAFVSIIRNKEILRTDLCHGPFCNGGYTTDSSHSHDLAGLLEASVPVRLVEKDFTHHEQARAAHFRALRDPSVVFIYPPDLPAPSTIVYPERFRLTLPAQLLDLDPETHAPRTPFDAAEFTARFTAAFAYAYPDPEAYRLGEMQIVTSRAPSEGWPVVPDARKTGEVVDSEGTARGLQGIMVIEPSLTIEVIPELARILLGSDPFSDMPEFSREPESVAARLDALAEDVMGHPCPGCFRMELPVAKPDAIKIERLEPVRYTLCYYEVAPDEPAAQQ